MPVAYERDDFRRLNTVTVTEPYSVDELLGSIDRQAREDTWEYAIFYDFRAAVNYPTGSDLRQLADHVKAIGGGRKRGPLGGAVGPRSELYQIGQQYAKLTKTEMDVEVLLTPTQIEDWLKRNTRSAGSSE